MVVVKGEGVQYSSCQMKLACPKPEIESKGSSDRIRNSSTLNAHLPNYPPCIYHTPKLSSADAFSFHSGTSNDIYVHLAHLSICERLRSS
jgi:hypothetical protein